MVLTRFTKGLLAAAAIAAAGFVVATDGASARDLRMGLITPNAPGRSTRPSPPKRR